jgi:hypothetical protein
MPTGIRFIAQNYDTITVEILEEIVLRQDELIKAETLKDLGYLHVEQIDFLQKGRIKHSIATHARIF